MVVVREARPGDAEQIREVHATAFPTQSEAELVEKLTAAGDALISIVASEGDRIIGHALFSRADAEGDGKVIAAMVLAPVAAIPDHQEQGIATAMVHAGLRVAEARGTDIIFVLGEPQYYRRFGFDTATAAPFLSPYAGPHFQALVLRPGFRLPKDGRVDYPAAFSELP